MSRGRRDAQRRPEGPYLDITPEWQAELSAALAERGRGSKKALADAIGCTAGAITGMLKPGARQSRLVAAVSKQMGIPLPNTAVTSDMDKRWIAAGRALDDKNWTRLVELAEELAADLAKNDHKRRLLCRCPRSPQDRTHSRATGSGTGRIKHWGMSGGGDTKVAVPPSREKDPERWRRAGERLQVLRPDLFAELVEIAEQAGKDAESRSVDEILAKLKYNS